ncbi:ribonuclease H-like protein [Aureobasidium sp. EXF-10728]|nr:ribonuclease H-like protein [Aureobasidium sp. EXF-10728]
MQSAGRAVTQSHQTSLHPSSRRALAHPAVSPTTCRLAHSSSPTLDHTWNTASSIVFAVPRARRHPKWRNASTLVFSRTTVQKRNASSKSSPGQPEKQVFARPRPNESRPNAAKPLAYRGRDTASSAKIDFGRVLSANPYQRGRTISPSGSPNAIFDPQIRKPSIVIRPPSTPSAHPEPAAPAAPAATQTVTPPASVLSRGSSTPDQQPAAPAHSAPQQHDPQATPPSTAPLTSSETPLGLTPDRISAHAVDHVAVPEGVTTAERPPESQSTESHSNSRHQPVGSTESRASVFDEVLRLEQKNTKLMSALAQHRRDYQELHTTHYKLQDSSTRTIQDAQRMEIQARERLQAASKKFEQERLDLQSTITKQRAARTELFQQLRQLEQQLADERETSKQRQRHSDRKFETTLRLREQEDKPKAARKLLRKDYRTFKNSVFDGGEKASKISTAPDLLPRQIAWYNREIAYWNKALQGMRSFEVTTKGGDHFRFKAAGEQVQAETQDLRERKALRQRTIYQLEQRLQHRDSVFDQIKGHLQNSSLEADRASSDYANRLDGLKEKLATISHCQHDWRRVLRETRFGMDSTMLSPELGSASRASAIDLFELDRPIADIKTALSVRVDFWKRKIKTLRAGSSNASETESLTKFYTTQLKVLFAYKSILAMLRTFSALQLEALEADWISDQPAYQQLFWQTSMRINRRYNQLRTKIDMVTKDLRGQGSLHERAAFAHAYVKYKKNAFTHDDQAEIREVFAQYRQENMQDSHRYLRRLEQVTKASLDITNAAFSGTLGKRLLVPARARRRDGLRKAALAKTKYDESEAEDDAKPVAEETGTMKDISRSASDAEMTSSPGSKADVVKSEAAQQETNHSPETDQSTEPEPTASEKPSGDSAENSQGETKPQGPAFKLFKFAKSAAPKTTTVYPRARSRVGFKPPKPMFKETRRRSQAMSTSSVDYLDKEELDGSTTLPPLLYHIPPQDLRNALMASKTSQAAFWRYSLYKSPSGEKPLLHYCTKFEQAEQVAKLFSEEPAIGFDIEWEMGSTVASGSIKDNVSLIQIACEHRIALFQIALFAGESKEDLMPPSLKAIIESPDIMKTGVNIAGDFTRMRKCLGVEGQGIFELSHLYKLVKFSEDEPEKVNKKPLALAEQVQNVLFLPLDKGNVRTSAWSRRLSMEQVAYAATDAYAGFRLFRELDKARTMMNPRPPRPALWELDQPIILGNGERAGETRPKRKTVSKKSTEVESQPPMLSVEEEQALNDEEEEAQAEAGADDMEDDNAQDEFEIYEDESAATVKHEAAERWLGQWESNLPLGKKGKNTPSTSIRAYSLWHVQGLELQQVAEAMRQPPLALGTVASYVLEVVKSERLPYESARLQEALDVLPSVAHWRYKSLIQKTRSEI